MRSYQCFLIDTNTYQCNLLIEDCYVGKCLFVIEDLGWIERLEISSRYRNLGYGSLLLEYVENLIRSHGCTSLRLVAWPDDDSLSREQLMNFYYKHGFRSVGINRTTLESSAEMVKLL